MSRCQPTHLYCHNFLLSRNKDEKTGFINVVLWQFCTLDMCYDFSLLLLTLSKGSSHEEYTVKKWTLSSDHAWGFNPGSFI